MNLADAQKDMRFAYFGGAVGLATSAMVWLAASAVAALVSVRAAIFTLLIGGMFIHPLAMALAKVLGRPGTHTKGNPLAPLALETTGLLLLGIVLAYVLAAFRSEFFFPAMLLVIGGRYLMFQTLYGLRAYWVCGGLLAAAAFACVLLRLAPAHSALAGGVIEAAFAAVIFAQQRREISSGHV